MSALTLTPELRDGLERCATGDPAGRASVSLPPEAYISHGALEHEQRTIFGLGWVCLGRSDRWPEPGNFTALDLAGQPLIVVRDKERVLRSYANTCRHRGSAILDGSGTCTTMRCPFHAWNYGLDGRLLGAPSMHRTPDFDKADHQLHEFTVEERLGFVFVSLEAEPPPIDTWLGGFGSIHAPWPLEDLVMTRRREFTVGCNWKLFAEVFNEYYHIPSVHPDSIDDTYLEPDEPESAEGAFASHFGETTATGGLIEGSGAEPFPTLARLPQREASGVRYSWLFPNVVIACGSDALWAYEAYPVAPDTTLCAQFVCFPRTTVDDPAFEQKAVNYYERFDVAIGEDIPALERQHRGLTSPHAQQGPFSYLEPSVARFASWYAGRMLVDACPVD